MPIDIIRLFIIILLLFCLIIVLIIFCHKKHEHYKNKNSLIYSTQFTESLSLNGQGKSNPFTSFNPSLKAVVKDPQHLAKLVNNTLQLSFQPLAGTSNIMYARIGQQGSSSCQDCLPLGGMKKGRFEFWIYFPKEDLHKINTYNQKNNSYPFYHGGKLLGICSKNCPTGGNTSSNPYYNSDWTLRIMFREKGVVALLYSIPDPAKTPFSLQPVPPPLIDCCPQKNCRDFFVSPGSTNADQYWFATKNKNYHPYRLAEYTFNSCSQKTNGCKITPSSWPNGIANPITPILTPGTWNFLRVHFDVDEGTAQMFHYTDIKNFPNIKAPDYTPSDQDLSIVVNTPKGSIPFTSKQKMGNFYFQPFFGGKDADWYPDCINDKKKATDTDCQPVFGFGDVKIFADF
jgi:hypothetical protein